MVWVMTGIICQNPGHMAVNTAGFHLGTVILRYKKTESYQKAADNVGFQDKRRLFTSLCLYNKNPKTKHCTS